MITVTGIGVCAPVQRRTLSKALKEAGIEIRSDDFIYMVDGLVSDITPDQLIGPKENITIIPLRLFQPVAQDRVPSFWKGKVVERRNVAHRNEKAYIVFCDNDRLKIKNSAPYWTYELLPDIDETKYMGDTIILDKVRYGVCRIGNHKKNPYDKIVVLDY